MFQHPAKGNEDSCFTDLCVRNDAGEDEGH